MTSQDQPEQFPLPDEGMIKNTYAEWVDKLECTCPGGAKIKPSPLPSATVNIGDVIADQSRLLSSFTSAYSMIITILKMIGCIIEVLCSINNPFLLIPALIRLFGTCLPDFILLFPQLAVPAIIVCLLKIILAIVEYILEVLLPLLLDIIENLSIIVDAFDSGNADAQAALAFKIAGLMKELYNVIGILSALAALFIMIKALLELLKDFSLPCGGAGGACFGCGDDQCPAAIKQRSLDGSDGVLTFFTTGTGPLDFELRFSSTARRNDFLTIRDFFPPGVDYSSITDRDKIAYVLDAYQVTGTPPSVVNDESYVVTSVRSNGSLEIEALQREFLSDGYLSNLVGGVALVSNQDIRFGTDTDTFDSSWVGRYLEIVDSFNTAQSGTYRIQQVYDGYNVRLNDGSTIWTYPGGSDPAAYIEWRQANYFSSSIAGSGYFFSLDINHEELLKYGLIGVGCHPAVSASRDSTNAKFTLPASLPPLPDINTVINQTNACLAQLAPITVDPQYVLDNYDAMAQAAPGVAACITNAIQSFEDDMIDYVNEIYPPIMDKEESLLSADPLFQIVGGEIDGYFTPIDLQGGIMGLRLPAGTLNAQISADGGTISSTTEVLDEYGAPTGEYTATLTSDVPLVINISADLDGYEVSDFDGYNFSTRYVTVEFILPSALERRPGDGIPEPLGVGSSAGE